MVRPAMEGGLARGWRDPAGHVDAMRSWPDSLMGDGFLLSAVMTQRRNGTMIRMIPSRRHRSQR